MQLSTTRSPLAVLRSTIEDDLRAVARIDAVPSILEVCCRVTGMGFAAVARVTDHRWTACAVRDGIGFGLPVGGDLPVQTTLCREVRASLTPVVIEHVREDAVYRAHPTPLQYGFQSYISVPIVLADGEYFGNLCAIDPRPAPLVQTQAVEMFELFAQLIAGQLDNERRHHATDTALAEARSTAELREQFIAVLGHDLRNPLSTVRTVGQLLQRPTVRDVAGLGQLLLKSVARMSSLIDDVLDFARGRLGQGMHLSLATEPQLAEALADVVTELQLAHPQRSIATDIAFAGAVRCDRTRVQQLLSNLVANALTHGATDQPVAVSARLDGAVLVLAVANAGPPIPPAQQRQLFQPFWRSGETQGLGLGLFICAEIARAHGGQMEVASDDADETVFRALLPLAGPPG